jgi:hypothetical protein
MPYQFLVVASPAADSSRFEASVSLPGNRGLGGARAGGEAIFAAY